jgi:hypothetical protein
MEAVLVFPLYSPNIMYRKKRGLQVLFIYLKVEENWKEESSGGSP